MKYSTGLISVVLGGMVFTAHGDTLTIPNTFNAGTPAVAAEVNANFDAAKSAVDDNDARITTLESSKQNRVSAGCAPGYSIRVINEDGSVVCELDNDSGGDAGHISISFTALKPYTYAGCVPLISNGSYWYNSTTTTDTSCTAYAPLQLPHGAYIDSLTCNLYDNDPGGSSSVRLSRVSNSSSYTVHLFETPVTPVDDVNVQELTDNTTAINNQVDNTNYNYMLTWSLTHDTSTVSSSARFHSCVIAYHY
jgi:hypothetical protein